MQACISQIQSLTRLEVSYIGTPFGPSTLDDLLGGLPTLQHVCLHFATIDCKSIQRMGMDSNRAERDWELQPVDFPQGLLRCV